MRKKDIRQDAIETTPAASPGPAASAPASDAS